MSNLIQLQLRFDGPNPIVAGDKRLTMWGLMKAIFALAHGSSVVGTPPGPRYVQYQQTLTFASATATAAAVNVADTVTIGGQALTATKRRASATLTAATPIAGTTAVINGVTFTGATGAVTPGAATFSVDTSNTAAATSLAAQINAYKPLQQTVNAKSAAAVVTVYAVEQGTSGNAITLVGTVTVLAASSSTLLGGTAIANNTFDPTGSDAQTALALATAITNSTTSTVNQTEARAVGAVVTVTYKVAGLSGNSITFVSSNGTRLAVTGSGFLAGGTAGAPVRLTF